MQQAISEITRRNIFDALRLQNVDWAGRLTETAFLSRIFDLKALPSHDNRCKTMLGDVGLHREQFHDWDDDWPFDDGRLNLLRAPDEIFLRFLCEMIHPLVRDNDDQVDQLVALFNRHVQTDGFHLAVIDVISGKRIFAAVHGLESSPLQGQTRKVADEWLPIMWLPKSLVCKPRLSVIRRLR